MSHDRARLDEIRWRLGHVSSNDEAVLPWLADELRRLLDVPRATIYGLAPTVDGLRVRFGHWSGFPYSSRHANATYDAALAGGSRFTAYDALRPERRQRNRVVRFDPLSQMIERSEADWRASGLSQHERRELRARLRAHAELFQRMDMLELGQLRILLCDGERLLGWFGVLVPDGRASLRQRRLLAAIAPWVRQHLRLTRALELADATRAALEVAMEALGDPAYLVGRGGAIVHATATGKQLLDAGAPEVQAKLARVRADGRAPDVDVFEVADHALVVLRSAPHRQQAHHDRAARAWRLTPREAEVLALLVTGDTNLDIATTLRCAEATIEVHVSRILRKASVDNRAALVAAYWRPAR